MPTPTDKAVILARGLGTRMRRADSGASLDSEQASVAATGLKAMIPIGRPFLDYVLSALADAGFRRVCLVIGPEHGAVRDYYTRGVSLTRVAVEFAIQERPLGTADAVAAASGFAGGDLFLVINSDNYYPVEACRDLRLLGSPGVAVFGRGALVSGGNVPPERVRQFSIVSQAADGTLERVLEKPGEDEIARLGPDPAVNMNCWMFGPSIFGACASVTPSARGELELPDAVQYSISVLGERYRVLRFEKPVLDMSSRSDIASVARYLEGVEVRL
ncbi:MAG: nucleotidyltransferase family protein [Vicinamibacterales bacterium]